MTKKVTNKTKPVVSKKKAQTVKPRKATLRSLEGRNGVNGGSIGEKHGLTLVPKSAAPAAMAPFDVSSLSPADRERFTRWRERFLASEGIRYKADDERPDSIKFDGDLLLGLMAVSEATGVGDASLGSRMLHQVAATFPRRDDQAANPNAALAAMQDLKPQDILEGQLMGQMVGVHNAAMRFLANAASSTDQDQIGRNVEWATKMLRTYTGQVEALNRYRGKGQQMVTVKHVTVHQGGQAVVGNVNAPLPGGSRKGIEPVEAPTIHLPIADGRSVAIPTTVIVTDASPAGGGDRR